jgi:spore maturation protein CgeB
VSGLRIAFFGPSLVSAYWNGAATYYRGIIRALAGRGHQVTFYEPDIYDRQKHRDMDAPTWARVVVYPSDDAEMWRALEEARTADVLIKTSGIGVFDQLLEAAIPSSKSAHAVSIFWDVDAPATLDRVRRYPGDPFRAQIPKYDLVLTHSGGDRVVASYRTLGARACAPIYNALDPATHYPVAPNGRFAADLSLLANRLPDREARVDEFFLRPAALAPKSNFLLGGNGWQNKAMPTNVKAIGHVFTRDHNALNCSARVVLNVNRESMVACGFSPPTRIFEAAGAGSCMISDAWKGMEMFFEPGREVLIARDGAEVAGILAGLSPRSAREIGLAAYHRVLACHTYDRRVDQLEDLLGVRKPSSSLPMGRAAVAGDC